MDRMKLIERLQAGSETLREVVNRTSALLPEHRDDASAAMDMQLVLARNYLVELAHNLVNGRDVYDAVLATARGETTLG